MYMWYILFFLATASARVHMIKSDFELMRLNPMNPINVTSVQLQDIVMEEWQSIVKDCKILDEKASIKASFDYKLVGTNTLAWASQTLLLVNNVWIPSISTTDYVGYDFIIGVNPQPINGWHIDNDCSDISFRYDLRTVLRHEILHGIGIGSSIYNLNGWGLGYNMNGKCYPKLFDTLIEDVNGNKVIDGCSFKEDIQSQDIFVNGVRLYNPIVFRQGSSISHHVFQGELMFWRLPAMTCLNIGSNEFKILAALGIHCPLNPLYESSASSSHHRLLLLVPVMLLLFCI